MVTGRRELRVLVIAGGGLTFQGEGTALCRGDSGGGLVFRGLHESKEKGDRLRYYSRGIASTSPTGDNLCNFCTITSFTHLLQQEYFIRDHYSGKGKSVDKHADDRRRASFRDREMENQRQLEV
ncbi:hypothetical protein EVAR_76106_1 [Eumeta japonica]|uniref:Peptidase S1 domain-containing protein n=1 Tax=Eumeta variegata TaxID=151549 RepID=A0A4C1W3B1_EUMVA|nr:hypothetical protein EVAR_76106_1 [Eumeta japonica]